MRVCQWWKGLLVCLLSLLLSAEIAAAFVDPIDAPAKQSELASSNWLLAVARAGKRLVAVGVLGHIVFSDDDGQTWKQAKVPVSVTLTSVVFPTTDQGWAVGHSGVVLHSSDGGATWEKQTDGRQTPEVVYAFYRKLAAAGGERAAQLLETLPINWENGPEQPWLDVWFENQEHGYIVGPFNLMMETRDGGLSWIPWMHRVDNPEELHFNAIRMIGDALYMASERGVVFRMKSGEKSFTALNTNYDGTLFGVCGKDSLVLAYGLRGTLYASTDGGDSWSPVETNLPTSLTDCVMLDDEFVINSMSGKTLEVRFDGAALTISPGQSANWPLSGLVATESGLLGVGLRGVWRAAGGQ